MSLFESLETRQHFAFGTLLTSYGTGGTGATTGIGAGGGAYVEAVKQNDGKTLVGTGGGLARFLANGAVDANFGASGVTPFKGFTFRDVAVDSSGRSYVLASGGAGTLVLRYTASGQLDTGFGTSGAALVEKSRSFRAAAIDVQADGKIVVAGVRVDAEAGNLTRVYRMTAAGAADTGFGTGGRAEFGLGLNSLIAPQLGDAVIDVKVLSSGKIEVLGSSYNYQSSGTDSDGNYIDGVTGSSLSALARLNSNGQLDGGFGTGGVARRATFDNVSDVAGGGTIRADGSAVIATSDDNFSDNSTNRTVFVGFSASGKTAFNSYTGAGGAARDIVDATALSDGRSAFLTYTGATFTVSADGVISNILYPGGQVGGSAKAIATTSSDDLILARAGAGLTLFAFDAGKATDPRPDNLPGALAIDTAIDTFGGLHVAFFDVKTKNLKYAYRDPNGYWGGIRTVDKTVGAGAAVSIDTYNNNGRTNVAIAYYDASTADLRLAASSTNGRKFQFNTVASRGYVGTSPSFQYTDNGGYAISYYSKSTKSLYYALNTGKGFVTELVDSGGSGESNELIFDPASRRPAIAYTGPKDTIKYALKDKATGWANPTVVATTGSGAAFINLAIPNDVVSYGGPRISYFDLATADLNIATFDRYAAKAKRWSTHTVASRGVVGAFSELAGPYYDSTLYAWSRSGDTVQQYKYSRGSGTATATVLASGGGQYLSVATNYTGDAEALAYLDTASGLTFVR